MVKVMKKSIVNMKKNKLEYWFQFNWDKSIKEWFVTFHARNDDGTFRVEGFGPNNYTILTAKQKYSSIFSNDTVQQISMKEIIKLLDNYTSNNDLYVVRWGNDLRVRIGSFADGKIHSSFSAYGMTPQKDGILDYGDTGWCYCWFITVDEVLKYIEKQAFQYMKDMKVYVDKDYERVCDEKSALELIEKGLKKRNESKK